MKLSEALDRLKLADQFCLVRKRPGGRDIRIVNRYSLDPDKLDTWAVCSEGLVLSRWGQWIFEPTPGDRSGDFIADTRHTLEAAFDIWELHKDDLPEGWVPE
ncbi:MAG: hypothetical protein DHS20C21_02950 [Gemmatimonadota bacterium]|nr:MAG: hypothetical protein DHS20C21_02950 [Gemmatimonadota bacterium]